MTATQKHDIIPICTTVLSADQPPKEDIMLDQQKITILYCRLSNEDAQEGESNSIANQREYLTRYARDHGYTNLKILVDDGYTGTNFNRPGVQEGFELVKQGLVGCWLVKDLSRFGRDYLTVGQYTDIIFPSYDVRFIAINDGVDSNRGTCTAHYIREDVLREIVLERIRAVNEYIRSDVDGFQEEWLQCRRTDQERSIRDDKKKLEQAKKRLADLDVIIARLYEDYVLGNLNQDRYRKMSADYEAEQERLKLEIEVIEEWVEQREEMNDGLDAFIALTQKYVDVEELTQTIVNEYIKKIIVYAPDKSSGKRKQKVKIFFNFVDDVDIPVISEPIITQTTYEHRKTA